MLRKEKYIKNIISNISFYINSVQTEVEFSNELGLYDIDIIIEDFFCGLLNLLYDYELENKNKEVKNAAAIDLYDSKHKTAVQVTADNTRDKVNKTIDMFIHKKLYKEYDRLLVVFSKDKPNFTKPFDTKGFFHFNPEADILDMKDLLKRTRALDTQKIKAVSDYIESEVDKRYSIDGKPSGESKEKSGRKFRRIASAGAAAAILIFVLAVMIPFTGQDSGTETTGTVYLSYIKPYTLAGYYESYDDVPPVERTELQTAKAFSILSFVRNMGEKSSMIENVYCDILELEPVEKPEIVLDAEVVGHKLRLFAFNNGWGDAKALTITNAFLEYALTKEELAAVCKEIYIEENSKTAVADVSLLAEYTLDDMKFQKFCEDGNIPSIKIQAEGEDGSFEWIAQIRYENGEFHLEYGGSGSSKYQITLFAVLNVDDKPHKISFTVPEETPVIDDKLRVETVLAPTKSCIVKCRNVFSVNGKPQTTETYTVSVDVPVFADRSIGYTGALTQELARLYGEDDLKVKQALKKYLYDPNSIRENGMKTD